MTAKVTVFSCLGAVILVLGARTISGAGTADFTGPGVVTAADVYVRSGPGQDAYPCAKLSHPARVFVIGRSTDGAYLSILPPANCFSVIAKIYVQPGPDGKVGKVIGENVWVRAGGELRQRNFHAIQCQLDKGETVKILGEVGEFYKIQPPEDACFWISSDYVEPAPVTPQEPAEAAVPAKEPVVVETQAPPAPPAAAEPAPTLRAGGEKTIQTTRPAEEIASAIAAFERAEADLLAEFKKPPEQRDLEKLIARYRAIPTAEDEYLLPFIEYRIAFLNSIKGRKAQLEEIDSLARKTSETQAEYEKRLRELSARQPVPVVRPKDYDARGVLSPSVVFTGQYGTPRWYLLTDPLTRRVNAYVMSAGGAVDLSRYVGQNVGVRGRATYQPSLGREVIDVQQVHPLGGQHLVPSPPRPKIQPLPLEPASAQPATGLPMAEPEGGSKSAVDEGEYE